MHDRRKLVLLGIDGQDPKVTERAMREGKLPNFRRLAENGGYARLATTNPAQSPVAWTTLATGVGPGYHGVFDFLKTVPERMSMDLAILQQRPGSGGSPAFQRVRQSDAFWDLTSAADIYTSIIRWPVTFPAEEVSGYFLSGLGTPDVQGRLGNYTFFTTRDPAPDDKAPDKVHRLHQSGVRWTGAIQGPPVARLTGTRPAQVAFSLQKRSADEAQLRLPGMKPITLRPGQWSSWLRVKFKVGWRRKVSGVCKCLLLEMGEHCSLYVSPVEIDPATPCFDISWPTDYAPEMVRELGTFHTLGMPEDTKGVTDRRFEPDKFLATCEEVLGERESMLNQQLELLPDQGLLAVVFDTLDRVQHLFWASQDPTHPIANEAWQARWGGVIEEYYLRLDTILGNVLDRIGPDTALLTFSDHGFESFRRAVHLNRWLTEEGYMHAQLGADDEASSLFGTVDWSRTRAYACGFGGIYLNLRGREAKGTVGPGEEADQLRREIAGRIQDELYDEEMQAHPIREAFRREDIFAGPLMDRAPDIFVGFNPGYRVSWQAALGGGLGALVEAHNDPWCGDHLMHPDCVPGVVFSNRPLCCDAPQAADIAPTVLDYFGLDVPELMRGRPLLAAPD